MNEQPNDSGDKTVRVHVRRPSKPPTRAREIVRELERRAQRRGEKPPLGNWPKATRRKAADEC